MPHIIIEYSGNLDGDFSPVEMMHQLHHAAIETGLFSVKGIKTRLARRDSFIVGNGTTPDAGFIFVVARMRPGRGSDTHKRVTQHLMTVLRTFLDDKGVKRPIGLNIEIEEIDTSTYAQFSNIPA